MEHEYTFNGQREDEKIINIVKNHPFILFVPGIKAIFFILIGVTIIMFWNNFNAISLALIFILIAIAVFFRDYYNYSQSCLVITDQRLIYIEQEGYLKRRITETEIARIQDVATDIKGLSRVILKYGDIIIRTASSGDGSNIVVKDVANPYEVQQRISKLLRKVNG